MTTYRIVRKYAGDHGDEEIESGLTLEEAQRHCNDSDTSSRTCTDRAGIERTKKYGSWFDCYYEE